MSPALLPCPSCHSEDVVKNGRTRHGKQNYKCRECGCQFVEDPQWRLISDETKGIVDRLLLEKISLAGIARALQISELWLQQYVNQKFKTMPQEVQVRPKKSMLHVREPHVSITLRTLPKRRLTVQMDELWSFVDDKGNEQWVWLSIVVTAIALRKFLHNDCSLKNWRPEIGHWHFPSS